MTKALKITINGAGGNMGRAICELANKFPIINIAYKLNSNSNDAEIKEACVGSDLVLDFSSADGLMHIIQILPEFPNCKLLVGTTALKDEHLSLMQDLAKTRAVMHAPNTSISANILAEFASMASQKLRDFDAEIVESHHRGKKDAPSGTALMIGQKIAAARGIDFVDNVVFDYHANGMRIENQIGIHSVRGGGIFGDNKVIFAGGSEVFTMEARALSRVAFAEGALKAAQWLIAQKPGLYKMKDYLEL